MDSLCPKGDASSDYMHILFVGLVILREAILKNHQLEIPPEGNMFNPTTKANLQRQVSY